MYGLQAIGRADDMPEGYLFVLRMIQVTGAIPLHCSLALGYLIVLAVFCLVRGERGVSGGFHLNSAHRFFLFDDVGCTVRGDPLPRWLQRDTASSTTAIRTQNGASRSRHARFLSFPRDFLRRQTTTRTIVGGEPRFLSFNPTFVVSSNTGKLFGFFSFANGGVRITYISLPRRSNGVMSRERYAMQCNAEQSTRCRDRQSK